MACGLWPVYIPSVCLIRPMRPVDEETLALDMASSLSSASAKEKTVVIFIFPVIFIIILGPAAAGYFAR